MGALGMEHGLQLAHQKNAVFTFEPLPGDDPKQRQPDITRARTLLGWEPRVRLEDGLRETLRYFRDLAERPSPVHPSHALPAPTP